MPSASCARGTLIVTNMNGAAFFLAVNFIIAVSFSTVFVAVATRSRSRIATLWLAAGFGVASLSAICELLVAYASMTKFWALGAFSTLLVGMVLLAVGICRLHGHRPNTLAVLGFVLACLGLSCAIYDLPRGSMAQAVLYQSPFAIVFLLSVWSLLTSQRRQAIDRFLTGLLLFTSFHFLMKAGLAVLVGSGATAKDYIHTNYAIISQGVTAVLVVAVGLTLLTTLVLDIMADERSNSEGDMLSSLANRRGLDRRVASILAKYPEGKHAVVLCDLDRFKRINDAYGHHVGDLVIQGFGRMLSRSVPENAASGRIGGEEFAVFLPNTEIEVAVRVAQTLRTATMALPGLPDDLQVTASFGISTLTSFDGLSEAYRRADEALYKAKHSGRNRVKIASNDYALPSPTRALAVPRYE